MIEKIVSGGQSGVDRAALDVALQLGIPCGGWCPRGRPAEDGAIPKKYPLTQTPKETYDQRTEWNVRDSDGTLILARGDINGGTALTVVLAKRYGRPFQIVDLRKAQALNDLRQWAAANNVKILNVAGSRESKEPGIYKEAKTFLTQLLQR